MNHRWTVVAVFVVACCFPLAASAQSINDVVRTFLKLEAQIETGLSLRDYSAALADVKFELRTLEDSSPMAAQAGIRKELQASMSIHTEASTLWRLTLGRYGTKFLGQEDQVARGYLTRYPDSGKEIDKGGAMMGGQLYVEALLPFLWRDAAMHVENARNLLAKKSK